MKEGFADSVTESLNDYLNKKKFKGGECEECGNRKKKKEETIARAPEILVIQLVRNLGNGEVLQNPIEYNKRLNLPTRDGPKAYHLYNVIHQMVSEEEKTFVTEVRSLKKKESWVILKDDKFRLEKQQAENNCSTSYLMFYAKEDKEHPVHYNVDCLGCEEMTEWGK